MVEDDNIFCINVFCDMGFTPGRGMYRFTKLSDGFEIYLCSEHQ